MSAPSPFDRNHTDPWARSFIDLPSLNGRATDVIIRSIDGVRVDPRSRSLLVLGPAGAGKTHLFARLRRTLGPRAVFVHLRPLLGTEMTPRYVLGELVRQLDYDYVTSEATQSRQLDALVGASLAHLRAEPRPAPRALLDELAALDDTRRRAILDAALETLLEEHREADEPYLRRLLDAPFARGPLRRATLAWLSGRELEESQLTRLGVPAGLPEERMIAALQTLGLLAAKGAPIVLVFDQLENLVDHEATGPRVRAYANLVAELFDTMRGFVLVQMALDTEWEQALLPHLSEAHKTRLRDHTELLALPTPAERRELVRLWASHLPSPWPFHERQMTEWCEAPGMTPRMLMIACRQALAAGPAESVNTPVVPDAVAAEAAKTDAATGVRDALEEAWQEHLTAARAALDVASAERRSADPARLAGGIATALWFASGASTVQVDARKPLQITARAAGREHGLSVLHQLHPRSVMAAIDRADDALSRGAVVVLRERALELPPTWKKVLAAQAALVAKGARWLTLERDDAARLLALESFVSSARSRDLEDGTGRALPLEDVTAWIERDLGVDAWPIALSLDGGDPESEPRVVAEPVAAPVTPRDSELGATIHACLTHLRVASLERLVREVTRATPGATHAQITGALEKMPERVRWFGRSILAIQEGGP